MSNYRNGKKSVKTMRDSFDYILKNLEDKQYVEPKGEQKRRSTNHTYTTNNVSRHSNRTVNASVSKKVSQDLDRIRQRKADEKAQSQLAQE